MEQRHNRRRSQRIAKVIPVDIEWTEADKKVGRRGGTELISDYGALIRLKTRQRPSNRLVVKNLVTGQSSEATLLYSVDLGGKGEVSLAVSLEALGESFWGSWPPQARS